VGGSVRRRKRRSLGKKVEEQRRAELVHQHANLVSNTSKVRGGDEDWPGMKGGRSEGGEKGGSFDIWGPDRTS